MAFPVVEATNTSTETSAVTSHTIDLPASIADGDLLIVIIESGEIAAGFHTFPAGWTEIFDSDLVTGNIVVGVAFRRADGTEGASIEVTTTNSLVSCHNSYRISGHSPSIDPEVSTGTNGTSSTPDPDSLDTSGDAKDYLWIAIEAHQTGDDTTAAPSSYTDLIEAHAGGTNSCASAVREVNATSEDPGTFTIAASRVWGALTLAVYPIEAGSGVQDTATSLEDAGNVTSHTVTLPANISSGDLLIICFSTDGAPTITWPSGANDAFTEFFNVANGTDNRFAIAYRQANGLEPSTVEVATSGAERSAHISYRITGHIDPATQAPEASTGATGVNSAPNPDSLTPTSGAKDYLWLATHGHDRDRTTDTFPADYAGGISTQGAGAGSAGVAAAERHLNAASENPGAFTINTPDTWVAATVAVHPAPLDVTLTPSPVIAAWSVPAPAIALGGITLTPTPAVAAWIVPAINLLIVGPPSANSKMAIRSGIGIGW